MLQETVAFCGVDCAACADYLRQACPGCRRTEWTSDDICMPVACCRERGIAVCAQCRDFPCEDMQAFYQESESHRQAYRRMLEIRAQQEGVARGGGHDSL